MAFTRRDELILRRRPASDASGKEVVTVQRQSLNNGEAAAGPMRQITLAAPGYLTKLCRSIPGTLLFAFVICIVSTATVAQSAFYAITAVLSLYFLIFSCNLSLSAALGAWRMRRACERDWDMELDKLHSGSLESLGVMHIVLLPNYKEDEQMLLHTLQNLGRSAMASNFLRVVLAMEEREGAEASGKANRLIEETKHLFAGITATFHPPGISGEVAGKSSNTQWAYREALKYWASDLGRADPTRVFVSVGDADTLWHPQFFSALTCEALSLHPLERSWRIWQPPVLMLRNLKTVPGVTRVSSYATILFELGGLANQNPWPALCYSSYSLTLALASHPLVNGWDTDVIAEDHHMFCKCYFASIRQELEHSHAKVASKLQLQPIYLPAISYLVESDDGWFASAHARFQQARRHAQGVAELSYVLLQYAHLLLAKGPWGLSCRLHAQIFSIVHKLTGVHIILQVQGFALLLSTLMLVPQVISWIFGGGLQAISQAIWTEGLAAACGSQSFGGVAKWSIFTIFGPIPPLGALTAITTFLVIRDLMEGKLTTAAGKNSAAGLKPYPRLVAPDVQGSAVAPAGAATASLGWRRRLALFATIQHDYLSWCHATLFIYGFVPVLLAAWSLLRKGHRFEYIVAAKPS